MNENSGLRKTAVQLAVTGLLVLIIAFVVGSNECSVRLAGECVPQGTAGLLVFVFGMFVLTWAAIFLAAHKVIMELRDDAVYRSVRTAQHGHPDHSGLPGRISPE